MLEVKTAISADVMTAPASETGFSQEKNSVQLAEQALG
jgi:hypothetical protein